MTFRCCRIWRLPLSNKFDTMESKPIDVWILAWTPTVTGCAKDPSPKLGAIAAYLAFHREVPSQRPRAKFLVSHYPPSSG